MNRPNYFFLEKILKDNRQRNPMLLLLAFTVFFHAIVTYVLYKNELPMRYIPYGEFKLLGTMITVGVILGPCGLLIWRLLRDMTLQLRGGNPPTLKERVVDLPELIEYNIFLSIIYLIVLIAYVNLKPAIPLLNPTNHDASLEIFERALFAGILPTEWIVKRCSSGALAFWESIYGLLSVFMFVSVTIALYYEGFRGGVRLTLAFSIGLFIDVFFTLWYPTVGPLFVHPNWFDGLRGLPSGELSSFLMLTVEQYRQAPGTVYACGGISAMPSYHLYGWICAMVYWRHLSKKVFLFALLLTLLNWASTFILGWHYLLDGLAGIVLALLVSWIMSLTIPRRGIGVRRDWGQGIWVKP